MNCGKKREEPQRWLLVLAKTTRQLSPPSFAPARALLKSFVLLFKSYALFLSVTNRNIVRAGGRLHEFITPWTKRNLLFTSLYSRTTATSAIYSLQTFSQSILFFAFSFIHSRVTDRPTRSLASPRRPGRKQLRRTVSVSMHG